MLKRREYQAAKGPWGDLVATLGLTARAEEVWPRRTSSVDYNDRPARQNDCPALAVTCINE